MKRGRPGRPPGRRRRWPALYPCPREGRSPIEAKRKRAYQATAQRRPFASPETGLIRQPQERQHSAANGGTRNRLPPARGAASCMRSVIGAHGPYDPYASDIDL